MATLPYSLRKQDSRSAAIDSAADHAISLATHAVEWLSSVPGLIGPDRERPLTGLRVLEVGPGPTMGEPVLLACAGAQVEVADRFLARWDPDFHPRLLEAMYTKLADRGSAYLQPLRSVLDAGAFAPAVRCHAVAGERLSEIPGTFDVVVSNAVLEHVEDLAATAQHLALKTVPGGYNFHQVDLRDHRSFDRPLEYLTLDEQAFEALRQSVSCECGAQWRLSDYVATLTQAGFDVTARGNMFADPAYLADLRPRLDPGFAGLSEEDLRTISAFFVLRRNAD